MQVPNFTERVANAFGTPISKYAVVLGPTGIFFSHHNPFDDRVRDLVTAAKQSVGLGPEVPAKFVRVDCLNPFLSDNGVTLNNISHLAFLTQYMRRIPIDADPNYDVLSTVFILTHGTN